MKLNGVYQLLSRIKELESDLSMMETYYEFHIKNICLYIV